MSDIDVSPQPIQHIVVNSAGAAINVLHQEHTIVVNSSDNAVSVHSLTQHLVVDPATSSVSIVNAGPMGPRGLVGPSDAESVLIIDGQIMTRVLGGLAPISRVDLAADPAFTDYWAAHLADINPHPVYLTAAEADALFLTPAEGDTLFLTPAEGNTAYVNVGGDTMTGRLAVAGVDITGTNTTLSFADGTTLSTSGDATWLRTNRNLWAGSGIIAAQNGLVAGSSSVLAGNVLSVWGSARVTGTLSIDPGTINGLTLSAGVIGNRIVCSDASGYIHGNYINMTADVGGGWPAYIAGRNAGDNYMRWFNRAGECAANRFSGLESAYLWNYSALCANPGGGYAQCSFHPGGIAVTATAVNGGGNTLYIRDSAFNALSGNLQAANFSSDSSRRWKKNINSYPLLPIGAAVPRVSDIITRLRPVTFETTTPDTEVPSTRRTKALEIVNKMRSAKGMDDYEVPIHDCAVHDCNGTEEKPCSRVLNREQMSYGFIAEEVYEVFPEVVVLDVDRLPAGIHINQLLAIAIAAIKELTERIRVLEGATV